MEDDELIDVETFNPNTSLKEEGTVADNVVEDRWNSSSEESTKG